MDTTAKFAATDLLRHCKRTPKSKLRLSISSVTAPQRKCSASQGAATSTHPVRTNLLKCATQ